MSIKLMHNNCMTQTKRISKIKDLPSDEMEHLNENEKNLINLIKIGLDIEEGFILTSSAFLHFLEKNLLIKKINDLISTIHFERTDSLMQVSNHIKKMVLESSLPDELEGEIIAEYKSLGSFFRKAHVRIGGSKQKIKENQLIPAIKKAWASRFDPANLLRYHKNKIDFTKEIEPLIVKKYTKFAKIGNLYTRDLTFNTDSKLSGNEIRKIKLLGEKIKKHFYFPQSITFGIKKNKTYIIDIKPMTNSQEASLVLIRHGRSVYNEKGLWAGWNEPPLTENGKEDVRIAAGTLRDIHFDLAYTSHLIRHQQTVAVIKKTLHRKDLQVIIDDALLERNYGDFTAKNKWEVEKQIGKEEFMKLRRSFNYPVPNGESLKQVYERVVPCYQNTLLPKLKSGKNILIASSGNALRALVKYLENISDTEISKLEIATGEVYVYKIDEDGKVVSKEIRNQHENKV